MMCLQRFFSVLIVATMFASVGVAEQATQSDAFVDSAGVNLHLWQTNLLYGSNFPLIESSLKTLGVRHIRDGVIDAPVPSYYYDRLNQLAADGIHGLFITARSQSSTVLQQWPAKVAASFEGYEDPNEYDNRGDSSWASELRSFDPIVYSASRMDGAATSPVVGPSLVQTSSYGVLGDVSASEDYGNLHNYFGGRNPGTPGWGTNAYGSIPWAIQQVRITDPNKPIWTTETGYQNDLTVSDSVPENVSAIYMPRAFLMQWLNGIRRTYLYELVSSGGQDFGLMRPDGSLKPAYTAVASLLNLLKDPGPSFTPSSLDYTITGGDATLQHLLLQKRDGSYYLALWLEQISFNVDTKQVIPVTPQPVSIHINQALSSATVLQFDDTGRVTSTSLSTAADLSLNVGATLMIVKLAPNVKHLLTVQVASAQSGSVTMLPASADGLYDATQSVAISAQASAGYSFSGFTGDITSQVNPSSTVMSSDRNVVASFSCTYSTPASSLAFASSSGTGAVSVTTGSGCAWTANSSASWISVAPAAGTGTGSVSLTYTANSGPARTAAIVAGSLTVNVSQASGNVAPSLSLTPATVKFGNQLVGSLSSSQIVTLANGGSVVAAISNIYLTGADQTSFTLSSSCGTSLAAGALCTLRLGMQPNRIGNLLGTLNVADNATGSPQSVALSGTGIVATTTTLTASANTATTGQNVTFTATVKPQSGTVAATGIITFTDGAASIGTGSLSTAGVATFSTTALGIGAHSIKASYSGDTYNTASGSSAAAVTISQTVIATATTLSASTTAGTTGQNISFTATVAPLSGTNIPTGTVTFADGQTTLGTGSVNASGSATFNSSTLAAGSHNLNATYGGDAKDAGSTSSAIVVNVTQSIAATATSLTASPSTASTGQNVSFTAAVSQQSGTGIPGGSVTFADGATLLGTSSLNSAGIATFNTSSLIAGSHSIAATYGGDAKDKASASAATSVSISQAARATAVSLAASATSATTGQSVSLAATVALQSGTLIPTGTITFVDGLTTLGSAPVNASGVATFSTAALGVGTHAIFAYYGGDAKDAGSNSTGLVVTISQGVSPTTTLLTSSAVTTLTGQSLTLSATVAAGSGSGVPTGTVVFLDGPNALATVPVSATGVASFATSSFAVGTHTISASYSGDAKDRSSVSSAVALTVSQSVVATTTSLVASLSSASTGQSVAFTATVSPASGTGEPSGTVAFLDGTTLLGTVALGAGGSASFSSSNLAAGIHTLTAAYSGDTKDAASTSSAAAVTISQSIAPTDSILTGNAASASTGQSVTFSVIVTPRSGSFVPTGIVTFLDGGVVLGTGTLGASGAGTFSTATLGLGTHTITAGYGGDAKDAASTSSVVTVTISQTVTVTSTVLSATPVLTTVGQSITFSATVSAQSGTNTPSGAISFLDAGAVIGSGNMDANGTASFATVLLGAGVHTVTASYGGDTKDGASASSAVAVSVSQIVAPTTIVLAISPTQSVVGQPATLTVIVLPTNGRPTGTVAFLIGQATLATGSLDGTGSATFTTASLPAGTYAITAAYSGDTSNAASVSAPVSLVVSAPQIVVASTTTTLAISPSQSMIGQSITMTAGVLPPNGVPTGTVTFLNRQTALGTAPIDGTGAAQFTTASLSAGTYSITAAYSGDISDAASASSAVSLTVSAAQTVAATTTTLAISPAQAAVGQSVTVTAAVLGPGTNGTLTGTVTFLNGQTSLGTAPVDGTGTALFTTASLSAGTYSITAAYSGDTSNAASVSAAISLTVTTATVPPPADYTLSIDKSNATVAAGKAISATVSVAPENGFALTVQLGCSGLPSGATCTFAPSSVTPAGATVTSTVTIATSGSASLSAPPPGRPLSGLAYGMLTPWGLITLLAIGARGKRSRLSFWTSRLLVSGILIVVSLWMAGCGGGTTPIAAPPAKSPTTYIVTITAAGLNAPSHTSQFTLVVTP